MLVLQEECFYVTIEKHLGHPSRIVAESEFSECMICPVCRNDKGRQIVPPINRQGTAQVLFHMFNSPADNITINKNRDAWTLPVLVREIRVHPNATFMILQSKMKGGISPDLIKRVLFGMMMKGILQLTYDNEERKAVFSLTHSTERVGEFALMEDSYWSGMNLKG